MRKFVICISLWYELVSAILTHFRNDPAYSAMINIAIMAALHNILYSYLAWFIT